MDAVKTQLPFFGLIKVSGEDAASFLHNQLSNDIINLPVNGACYACYNTPQGRVLSNILVVKTSDAVLLFMAQDLCATIAKRLRMYVLRSKVLLEESHDYTLTAFLPTNIKPFTATTELPCSHEENIWQIELPHGCYYQLTLNPTTHAIIETSPENLFLWNKHEILAGFPWISAPTSEKCVAQMLNLHTTGGVHFKKGCYPGQEIIARAQYRGQVRRGLVSFFSPVPLSEGESLLNQNNEEIGVIINTASDKNENIVLAVVKHVAAETAIYAQQNELKIIKTFFEKNKDA